MTMDGVSGVYSLTDREHEILRCVANGQSNTAIAARLGISVYTVRNHLTHIFKKLGVHSRTQAVVVVLSDRSLRDGPAAVDHPSGTPSGSGSYLPDR